MKIEVLKGKKTKTMRPAVPTGRFKIRTGVKAGGIRQQHNRVLAQVGPTKSE